MRLSASPVGYIGWLMLLESLCVPMFALVRRRDVLLKQPRRLLLAGLAAGALSVLAYGLVLWAQTRGALAPIAALRETSVIFGAIIGDAHLPRAVRPDPDRGDRPGRGRHRAAQRGLARTALAARKTPCVGAVALVMWAAARVRSVQI